MKLDYSFKPVFEMLQTSLFFYGETTRHSAKKEHLLNKDDLVILDSIGDGFEVKHVFLYRYDLGTIKNVSKENMFKLVGYIIHPYSKLNCMFSNKEKTENWSEQVLSNLDIISSEVLQGDNYSETLKLS